MDFIVIFTICLIAASWPSRVDLIFKIFLIIITIFSGVVKSLFLSNISFSDAHSYYLNSRNLEWGIGSGFVANLAQYIRYISFDDFYTSNILFILPPVMACLILNNSFWQLIYKDSNHRLYQILFLSTVGVGVGFWGAGISKDGLSFLGIALIFSAFSNEKSGLSVSRVLAGIVLVACVRLHIAVFAGMALGIVILLGSRIGPFARALTAIGGVGLAIVIFPVFLEYVGLDTSLTLGSAIENLDSRAGNFSGSGSFVDLRSMSPPMRFVTYLFRPLPWEASGLIQLIAAIQNTLLVVLFVTTLFSLFRVPALLRIPMVQFAIIFLFLAGGVLSYSTSNLGIASRQKWMILITTVPVMLILISSYRRRLGAL